MRHKIVLLHNTTRYLHLHYRDLIESLLRRNCDVVCVAPADETVQVLEKMGVRCEDVKLSRGGMNPFADLRVLLSLRSILAREHPDVVFNYSIKPTIYGSLAARAVGVRHIFSMITGLGYVFTQGDKKQWLLRLLVVKLYRLALGFNEVVFFQNSDDRQVFDDNSLVDRDKTSVLAGTGINTREYTPATTHQEKPSFLMVTRLLSDKGIYEYVDAARRLKADHKEAEFRLLGPFDDNPAALSQERVSLWVQEGVIKYIGETSDVRPYLAESSVFVLPSYREGLPRATLEAMAMAKPIITTDVPGCRETVVDQENGFLVPPRDSTALAGAMERFLKDPVLVSRMGQRSRRIVLERFDVHKVNSTIVRTITENLVA